MNATANPSQTFHQPHTAPYQNPSSSLPSSSSVPSVILHPVYAQNSSLPFVAMKVSSKTFEGLDQQHTPED